MSKKDMCSTPNSGGGVSPIPKVYASVELAEETGSRYRRLATIRWQTVPGHWNRDSETARPIVGQASPWNDEVTVNGRRQMSAT